MYDKFFDNDFVEIVKTLEEKASAKGLKEKTETLKKFEGKGFCLKINALKKIANELGYKLNLELEEKDSNRHLHLNMAGALSKDYSELFYVDFESGNYMAYHSDKNDFSVKIRKKGDDFFKDIKSVIKSSVYPEDRENVLFLYDKKRLSSDLKENGTDLFTCRVIFNGKPIYVKTKITRMKSGGKDCLVIGISNVDAQVRRRKEYERTKEESLTFSRIAQALSRDYYSIYYIDVNTDGYIEYASHYDYKELEIEKTGDDFFADCERNVNKYVYRSDRAKILRNLRKETLLQKTENDKSFTVSYRLMISDKPVHVGLKAVRTDDKDGHHILIGIRNIDDQIKREKFYKKAINDAQNLANQDTLTGVKNKRAYDEKEKTLNDAIATGACNEFSVVVCDVNDLKSVNDRSGHKAGDECIKEAAESVCKVFANTPVYRIGGDDSYCFYRATII